MWNEFKGFGWSLGNLPLVTNAKTFSICAENPTGEKGKGGMAEDGVGKIPSRELGRGWKVSPCLEVHKHEKITLAEIDGPGVIQHVWITTDIMNYRKVVLRMYWDGEESPSVEVPLGDFFAQCWNVWAPVNSVPVVVNPRAGLNCYWPMPFHKSCKITIENITPDELGMFFYQISGTKTEVPENSGTFHARFRRENPVGYKKPFTIIDDIKGHGHYVGTFMGWQANNTIWWGEGEIKFYMDGDEEYPTICGTGTEDYFGGAWGFEEPPGEEYETYSTPFLGFPIHVRGNGHTTQGRRFGLYRWHVMDPICFEKDLRVTIQALGLAQPREGQGRYLPLQDDLCAVSYWYQKEPHNPVPSKPLDDEFLAIH